MEMMHILIKYALNYRSSQAWRRNWNVL